jgi:hypothetical protein
MANRYWVGGTGTWDTFTTTNWSTTSGGAGGASVPAAADTAIFDSLSNAIAYTCTRTTTTTISSLQMGNPLVGALTFAGTTTFGVNGGNVTISSGVNWTHTGTFSLLGGLTVTTNGVTLTSNVNISNAGAGCTLGSALTTTGSTTLTQGGLVLNGFSLTCNTFVSNNTNTRSISFGSSAINITGSGATIMNMGNATGFTYTGTPTVNCTYSGSTGTRTTQFGTAAGATESNVLNINITAGSDATSTGGGGSSFKNLNFTGYTGTLNNAARTIYGNLIFGSGMTTGGSGATTTFGATSGTQTLTCNGVTVTFPFLQNGVGGTVQLGGALTTSNTYTLTNGVFNANNYNVTVTAFSSNNSNTRTITMGSGAWTLTAAIGTVTVWDLATTTGLTFNKNTANIQITSANSGTKTFAGGGLTYNNLTITVTVGSLIIPITGANTFNTLSSTQTNDWILTLPASATTTVGSWSIEGVSGTIVTLNSSTAGTQATLTSNGSGVISSDYLSIQDSAATPSSTWYAGANSTDVSNNTGWIFTVPPVVVSNSNFFLMFG